MSREGTNESGHGAGWLGRQGRDCADGGLWVVLLVQVEKTKVMVKGVSSRETIYFFTYMFFFFREYVALTLLKEMLPIQHTSSLLLNLLVMLVAFRPDPLRAGALSYLIKVTI